MSARAMALIHDDRLFPADPTQRSVARRLYAEVRDLPLISPHGHTQAAWFARNQPFPDPAKLFVQPDHYVYRMLYSQGISLEDLEIGVDELKNPAPRLASVCGELLPVPRHAYAPVARLRVPRACLAWRSGSRQPRPTSITT